MEYENKMHLRIKRYNSLMRLFALIGLFALTSCVPEVVKYNDEGNTEYEQAAYDEALDAYRLAQVSEPDLPEPYYNAANTYNRQGDVAGTALQTEQALKSAETDLQSQAWYNLGNAYFDAQQWSQAVDAYKQALRLNPDDADAKHNLELALKAIQDQQTQDEENQQQDQQENTDQNEQDNSEEESNNEQGTEESPSQIPESNDQDNSQQTNEETQEMTPEQARQLLEALLGDSETLQEHLQKNFVAPGSTPEEDW
jgi:Ca-activated chloride channel family protein